MSSPFSIELLQKKWIHSHEEDHGNEIVYRPSSHQFPPSRGRSSFELAPGGRLMIGGPGPDDRQLNQKANWEIDGNSIVFRLAGSVLRKLRIISIDYDRLVVTEG